MSWERGRARVSAETGIGVRRTARDALRPRYTSATMTYSARVRAPHMAKVAAMMKLIFIVAGVIVLIALLSSGSGSGNRTPSDAELRQAASRIMATCEQRVLGRVQREGERIGSAQASAITSCIDEMGGAYVAGVKAGR